VHGIGADMKKECLEELQPGWLVRLIRNDTEDEALLGRVKSASQAKMDDMDDDMEVDPADEDNKSWNSLQRATHPRISHERTRTGRLRQAEARIAALREAELNPVRKARNDDLAVQEQGLHFIRNFIGLAMASKTEAAQETADMIDYLFSQIGQDQLFEIFAEKLRPRVLNAFGRRHSGQAAKLAMMVYPQPKIIAAVVFILVHISASVPRHRQLVIAQTDLLRALAYHFSSKDKEVRVSLCHLFGNLTDRDEDGADTTSASQRAFELKRLGVLSKLEVLEQEDNELDVRERAKTAVFQMKEQING
jgi:armadillo repeat-containing protein 8